MANVEARLKVKGKHYEIMVDLDEALKIRSGKGGNIQSAMQSLTISHDVKTGKQVAKSDLMDAFGTADMYEIAKVIITKGEVQKNQEFRDEEREKKVKQVVSLLLRNAVDQHGHPYTEERLRRAIDEVHFSFDNRAPEQQMHDLLHKLKDIIPIKIEIKKVKIKIPARYTGHVYGIISDYKQSEEWLSNGDLEVILNIPSGLLLDFYDKLNSVTHGSVQSEELKE